MQKKGNKLITTKSKSIVLALFSFVIFYVFTYMIDPYDIWWQNYFKRPFTEMLLEWSSSLLFCMFISLCSIFIHSRLNHYLSWMDSPLQRLAAETFLNIICVVGLVLAQVLCITLLTKNSPEIYSSSDEVLWQWQWLTISIFMAFIISAIHTGDYLITNWKNAALEATEHKLKSAQHKQAAAEAELQALKLQLDPHFVFNNLSVLSELILEDQKLGYDYSENFSKVYRYLLLNSRKDLITLEEELKFLRAYIFLLHYRAGSGIAFEINIDSAHLSLQLPPLTLQLLIENAMKHNKLLKSNPLKIAVCSGINMDLIVCNSLIPLDKSELSPGLGLNNIVQRYELLSEALPVIEQTDKRFIVTIPLIKG
jgi:two-component system LytT family sensor kinase